MLKRLTILLAALLPPPLAAEPPLDLALRPGSVAMSPVGGLRARQAAQLAHLRASAEAARDEAVLRAGPIRRSAGPISPYRYLQNQRIGISSGKSKTPSP